jgi:hypothetical protein
MKHLSVAFLLNFVFLTDQLYLLRGHLVNVKGRKNSNIRQKATARYGRCLCNKMYQGASWKNEYAYAPR